MSNATNITESAIVFENDSLKFIFSPTDMFWGVRIENRLNKKISCDWDQSFFITGSTTSQIVFDDTNASQKNSPKGTSTVFPGTSVTKQIFALDNWKPDYMVHMFEKKILQKYSKTHGNYNYTLILTIVIDNKNFEYKFTFEIALCN